MVQRYLQRPLLGASELQMKELIHLICTAKRARIVRDCLTNMGVTDDMSEDTTLLLKPPAQPTTSGRCICLNATTSVQGRMLPRCETVLVLEVNTTAACPFLDPKAAFLGIRQLVV